MWNVNSRPHHFHPRGEKTAIESPMKGNPNYDIPIFLKELLEKEFKNLPDKD